MMMLFHQGALGDWVLTFAVLRGVPAALADESVTVVTAACKGWLAAHVFAHVRALDVEQCDCTMLHAPDGASELSAAMRGRLESCTHIISFISDGKDTWAHNVRQAAPRARLFFIAPRPPRDWAGHVCDWHAQQLSAQGLALADVNVPPRRHPTGPMLIHPGSGGRDKCWPIDRFEQLITALSRAGGNRNDIRIILGEVERERWPDDVLNRLAQLQDVRIEQPETLTTLHDLIARARLFIGNDAGPTHLAAQTGVPTLALFGPTDPAVWSPRGPQVHVLAPPQRQPMTWLNVKIVLEAVLRMIGPDRPAIINK